MTPDDDEADLERLMDASAAFLGVPLPADGRAGVLENLKTLRRHAALVMEFPVCDATDSAPMFRP